MSANKISDFYGKAEKCACTNPEIPEPCNRGCFCRGYTAQCLNCLGEGQKEEPVAGGNGTTKAVCNVCGGKGKFPINKPADWDILNSPEEIPHLHPATHAEHVSSGNPHADCAECIASPLSEAPAQEEVQAVV